MQSALNMPADPDRDLLYQVSYLLPALDHRTAATTGASLALMIATVSSVAGRLGEPPQSMRVRRSGTWRHRTW
jgi:hypothetical protein